MFKTGDTVVSSHWNPQFDDGAHWRARLGFILMSTDFAAESDILSMTPNGVGCHFTRLKTDDYTTNATLSKHINSMADAASRIQPDGKPNVISYSCTSGSIVNGELNVMEQIKKGAPYCQPMTLVTGILDALRELEIKRLVVGTPYIDEINTVEAEFLFDKGYEILNIQGLNLTTGVEMGMVTPEFWRTFALAIDQREADAVFLSCSGIRALEVVDDIEKALGKPVITSNQGQMWSCLRRAGISDKIEGFGSIFSRPGHSLLPKRGSS